MSDSKSRKSDRMDTKLTTKESQSELIQKFVMCLICGNFILHILRDKAGGVSSQELATFMGKMSTYNIRDEIPRAV